MGNAFDRFSDWKPPEQTRANIFDQFHNPDGGGRPPEQAPTLSPTAVPDESPSFIERYLTNEDPKKLGRIQSGFNAQVQGLADVVAGGGKGVATFATNLANSRNDLSGYFDRIDRGEYPELPRTDDLDDLRAAMDAYRKGGAEERARLRIWYGPNPSPDDPRDTTLYKAGEELSAATRRTFPTNPAFRDDFFTQKAPYSLGTGWGFALTGGLGRAAGLPALPTVASAGAAVNAADVFEDALNEGADLDVALEASNIGALVGTAEAIPIAGMFNRLDKFSGGVVRRTLVDAMKQGSAEAVQEVFNQVANAAIARDMYDPERGLFEGTGEAGALGFTTGAVMSFIASLVGARRLRSRRPTQEATAPPEAEAPDDAPPSVPPGARPAEDIVGATPEEARPTRADLEELLEDERPVEEIKQADARLPVADGSPENPIDVVIAGDPDVAAERTETPSPAQAKAGNYRKRHIKIHGMDVAVETERGGVRSGLDAQGKPWSVVMPAAYGYVKRTEGADGDQVDVYIGPSPESQSVFVVDQVDAETGAFDEHKAMIGFPDQGSALAAYIAAFNDGKGPDRVGAVHPMDVAAFRGWLEDGDTTKPLGDVPDAPSVAGVAEVEHGTAPPAAAARPGAHPIEPLLPKARAYVQETKKVLTPRALARALDTDTETASAVLQSLSSQGVIGRTSKGGYRRLPKREIVSLNQFLASRGGIRDEAGELRAMDAQKWFSPGFGNLVRNNGMPLDTAREAAAEAGYIPDGGTVAEFIEAIREEIGGRPVLTPEMREKSEAEATARQLEEEKAEADGLRQELRGLATTNSIVLTDEQIDAALEQLMTNRSVDPADIIDEIAERAAIADVGEFAQDATTPEFEVPFDAVDIRAEGEAGEGNAPASRAPTEPDAEAAPGGEAAREQHGRDQPPDGGEEGLRPDAPELREQAKARIRFYVERGDSREGFNLGFSVSGAWVDIGFGHAKRGEVVIRNANGEARYKLKDLWREIESEVEGAAPNKPTPTIEGTDAGDQSVVPGAEKISDRELAERRMEGRKKAEAPQRPADEGLFDVAGRGQGDLLDVATPPASESVAPARPSPETISPDDLDFDRARRAFEGMSFDPEKRAREEQEFYVEDVSSLRADLAPVAETDQQKAVLDEEVERYRKKYLAKRGAWLDALSRTMSPMIAGPANFPVARNNKRLATERKRSEEFTKWRASARQAAQRAVLRARSPEQVSAKKLDDAFKEIGESLDVIRGIDDGVKEFSVYNRSLFVNSISGKLSRLAKSGETEVVREILDHIRTAQAGRKKPLISPRHSMWGLVDVAENSSRDKESAPTGEATLGSFGGGSIVNNFDAERVQVIFDSVPPEDVRADLRGEGWRWSRANKAWQRKNTNAAIASAIKIAQRHFGGVQLFDPPTGEAAKDAAPVGDTGDAAVRPTAPSDPAINIESRLAGVNYEDGAPVVGDGEAFAVADTAEAPTKNPETRTPFSPVFREKRQKVYAALRAELDRLGLKEFALRLPDRIEAVIDGEAASADGRIVRGLIDVALDARDPMRTLRHEAVHGLYRLGLFTEAEWRTLTTAAERLWMDHYGIDRRYANLGAEARAEEAIAEAYADWRRSDAPVGGRIRRAFNKMRRFLTALRNALRGNGFQTVDDVFQRVETGEVGGRPRRPLPAGPRFSVRVKRTRSGVSASFEAGRRLFEWLGVKPRSIFADLDSLQRKHPEYFPDRASVEAHIESVLANPDEVYPSGAHKNYRTVVARLDADRMISLEIVPRGHRYIVRSALVLDDGQLERQVEGAARRHGATHAGLDAADGPSRVRLPEGRPTGTPSDEEIIVNDEEKGKFSLRETEKEAAGGRFFAPARDLREHLARRAHTRLSRLRGAASFLSDKARFYTQDKQIWLKRTVEAVARARNVERLEDQEDAYLAETLYSGRTGDALRRLERARLKPLIEKIHDLGLGLEDIDAYLYARHAKERNAQIARINPETPEGGSGMTDADADAIMAAFERAGKARDLETIAGLVDSLIAESMMTRVKAGLLDKETARKWLATYQHYVPLRGFAEESLDEGAAQQGPRIGKGYDIRGAESKRAMGRRSEADSILANVVIQAEEAIIRAEKNKVGQTLLRMAEANPNPDFWEVSKVERERRINPHTGLVETVDSPFHHLRDNVLSVKRDGQEYYITLHHDGLARGLKNLGADDMGNFLRVLQQANRFLAFVNTSSNPEFVVSNAFRDIQTGFYNLTAEEISGLRSSTMRDVRKALMGAWGGVRGKGDTEWRRYFKEYAAAGGKTEFFGLETIEGKKRRLNAMLRELEPGQAAKYKQAFRAAYDVIQDANAAVENAVRLSAFVNARRLGMSKPRAAALAKNLTVNFNRKGLWGPQMGALYLFYNASLQGTVRMVQALAKSRRTRRLVGGVIAASVVMDLVNWLLSPVGDEGEKVWDSLSEWEKSHNLILMNPFASADGPAPAVFKVPMPYGYNVFAVTGLKIGEVLRGKTGPMKAAADIALAATNAFNPLGGSDSILKNLVPTVLKPSYELAVNENFAGSKIRPDHDRYGAPTPESQRYFNSVRPWSREITERINDLTGGSKIRPGLIDVSPEVVDHYIDFVTGGSGMFVSRALDLPLSLAEGKKKVEWNDVPVVRKFLGDRSPRYVRSRYYTVRDAVTVASDELEYFRSVPAEKERVERDYAPELAVEEDLKKAEFLLRTYRKALRAAEARGDDTSEHQARIDGAMTEFLKRYNNAKKRRGERR